MKKCSTCGEMKSLDHFYKNNRSADGHGYKCKICMAAVTAVTNAANYRIDPRPVLLRAAKTRARNAGLPFNITVDDIVIPTVCPILGITLVVGARGNTSPSIDKLVPALGYVKGNVNVISWKANRMKQDSSLEELEALCAWMRSKL